MFTVNTSQDYKGGLEYDPVPYLNFGTDHLGHLFVMGKNLGSEDCVYVGAVIFSRHWLLRMHIHKQETTIETWYTTEMEVVQVHLSLVGIFLLMPF